jgi:hypothetical protein
VANSPYRFRHARRLDELVLRMWPWSDDVVNKLSFGPGSPYAEAISEVQLILKEPGLVPPKNVGADDSLWRGETSMPTAAATVANSAWVTSHLLSVTSRLQTSRVGRSYLLSRSFGVSWKWCTSAQRHG